LKTVSLSSSRLDFASFLNINLLFRGFITKFIL